MKFLAFKDLKTGEEAYATNALLRLKPGFYDMDIIQSKQHKITGLIVWTGIRFEMWWLKPDGDLNNIDANCGFPDDAEVIGSVLTNPGLVSQAIRNRVASGDEPYSIPVVEKTTPQRSRKGYKRRRAALRK